MTSHKYMTPQEAADRYKLSKSWLAKLRVSGGGPSHIKCGRRILYDAASFETWLETQRRNSTSDGQ